MQEFADLVRTIRRETTIPMWVRSKIKREGRLRIRAAAAEFVSIEVRRAYPR